MYSIHDVTVAAVTGSGTSLCSTSGVTTSIEFMYEFGDLPLLTSDRSNLLDSTNTQPKQFNYGYATFSENFKGLLLEKPTHIIQINIITIFTFHQVLRSTMSALDKDIVMPTQASVNVYKGTSPAQEMCTFPERGVCIWPCSF
jgi:hypothetical protein